MKHLLIILISIALLSSLLISCTESSPSPEIEDNLSPVIGDEHKGETLYRWGDVCCDYKWMGFGDKDLHPKYLGQVKNVKPNGLGILIEPNGSKYVGSWKDGQKNGQGIFTSLYGQKNGQGTFTSLYGSKYVGEWKNGRKDGQGTITWSDGEKYEGQWKDGEKNGQGTFIHGKGKLEGQKYEGEYKDGFYWNGTLHDKDGNIVGKYVNGKIWKQ